MKKKTFIKLGRRLPIIYFIIAISAIVLFALIGGKLKPSDIPGEKNKCMDMSSEWQLKTESGNKNIKLPYRSNNSAGKVITIFNVLPDDLDNNMVLCVRADQVDMKLYVDGVIRESYSTEKTRFFGKVSARRYLLVNMFREDAGKEVRIDIKTTLDNTGSLDIEKYGDRLAIVKDITKNSIDEIVIAFIMLVVCVITLAAGIIISITHKTFAPILHLSVMGILASIWILCNAEASQFYFKNMSLTFIVDYVMLMLLPFPFLFFMNSVQNKRYNILYKCFEYIAVFESVVCITLSICNIVDVSQLFLPIAGVFGSTLVMILITIGLDVFKRHNRDYIIIAIGILAGIVATIIQFAIFLLGSYEFGGVTVAIALLIMLTATVIDTYKKMQVLEAEKQMAIAQGKAESNFLANMSHEIRTPINAVLGMNEMILRESEEKQILEYAKNIDNSGNMLLAIVNDILDFSKIRSGKMQIIEDKYSLVDLLDNVCEMIGPKAEEKNLLFEVDIDKYMYNDLIGDEIRIKQIMINILSNAVKYTDAGTVKLTVKMLFKADKTYLHFEVKDSGRGIRENDIDSLFDAFSRVDEKKNRTIEGTGLGLALVKNLLDAMNGTVKVESKYTKGSTFIVDIPQNKVGEQLVAGAMELKKTNTIKRDESALFVAPDSSILVVDDVKVNLSVVKGLLKRTQMKVVTALSGEQCIEALKKKKFDIVLLDHLMPVMDGVETLTIIRKENLAPNTKIIALTANAIPGAREEYLEYGFDDYLSKPIKGEELEAMIQKYLQN